MKGPPFKMLIRALNLGADVTSTFGIWPSSSAFFWHAVFRFKYGFSWCACVAEVTEAWSIKPSGNIRLSSLTSRVTRLPWSPPAGWHQRDDITTHQISRESPPLRTQQTNIHFLYLVSSSPSPLWLSGYAFPLYILCLSTPASMMEMDVRCSLVLCQ